MGGYSSTGRGVGVIGRRFGIAVVDYENGRKYQLHTAIGRGASRLVTSINAGDRNTPLSRAARSLLAPKQ